jgi:hypothetical protein
MISQIDTRREHQSSPRPWIDPKRGYIDEIYVITKQPNVSYTTGILTFQIGAKPHESHNTSSRNVVQIIALLVEEIL